MKIAEVLNRKGTDFRTIGPGTSLRDAVEMMYLHEIGSVGIAETRSGTVEGIISQRELMAGVAQRGVHALSLPAVIFMRRPVLFCFCDDEASNVMATMTHQRIRHIVVRKADGAIAGLVSLGDLVAALLDEAQLEALVLRDMARGHLLARATS